MRLAASWGKRITYCSISKSVSLISDLADNLILFIKDLMFQSLQFTKENFSTNSSKCKQCNISACSLCFCFTHHFWWHQISHHSAHVQMKRPFSLHVWVLQLHVARLSPPVSEVCNGQCYLMSLTTPCINNLHLHLGHAQLIPWMAEQPMCQF